MSRAWMVSTLALSVLAAPWWHAAADQAPQLDLHGDPLPPGAVARLGTVRLRHGARVYGVAISTDDKTLVSSGGDGFIRCWEIATGRELWAVSTKGSYPGTVQFTPDGGAVVAAVGRFLLLLDSRTGHELRRSADHESEVGDVILSVSGKWIASRTGYALSRARVVRVTEAASWKEVFRVTLDNEKWPQDGLSFTKDERLLLLSPTRETVDAWEISTRKKLYTLTAEWLGQYWQLTSDGASLVAKTADGIGVWDVTNGKPRLKLRADWQRFLSLHLVPTGRSLVLVERNAPAVEYGLVAGSPPRVLPDADDPIIGISPDGAVVARASLTAGSSVRLRDLTSGRKLKDFPAPVLLERIPRLPEIPLQCLFAPDKRTIALVRSGHEAGGCGNVAGGDGILVTRRRTALLELREVATGKVLVKREYPPGSLPTAFTRDGRYVVSWWLGPGIRVWHAVTGHEVSGAGSHDGAIRAFRVSPDGKTMFSVDENDSIRAWDAKTGRALREFPRPWLATSSQEKRQAPFNAFPPAMSVQDLAVSHDGRYLASLERLDSWLEVVRIWDASSGNLLANLAREYQYCFQSRKGTRLEAVAFAPNGVIRVAGFSADEMLVWNAKTSRILAKAAERRMAKPAGQETPNGLVSLEELAAVTKLEGPRTHGSLARLGFSSDAAHVLNTLEFEKTSSVIVHDAVTGLRIFQTRKSPGPATIVSALSSRSGMKLAVAAKGKPAQVQLWDLSTGKVTRELRGGRFGVDALAFSPDGKLLAAAAVAEAFPDPEDSNSPGIVVRSAITLWDTATGKELQKLLAHQAKILKLEFSPDSKMLVSGSADSTMLVWDLGVEKRGGD